MIYAVSDIHGCYEQYKAILDKTGFSGADTLYVLGMCWTEGLSRSGFWKIWPEDIT